MAFSLFVTLLQVAGELTGPSDAAAVGYSYDVLCNNGSIYACVCFEHDGRILRAGYRTCKGLINDTTLSVVQVKLRGFEINHQYYYGETYEQWFKRRLANLVDRFCQRARNECAEVNVPVQPHGIVLLSIGCLQDNSTVLQFIIANRADQRYLNDENLIPAELLVRVIRENLYRFQLLIGQAHLVDISVEQLTFIATAVPDDDAGFNLWNLDQQMTGFLIFLIVLGVVLVLVYVVAILKAIRDYRAKTKERDAKRNANKNNPQTHEVAITVTAAANGGEQVATTNHKRPANKVHSHSPSVRFADDEFALMPSQPSSRSIPVPIPQVPEITVSSPSSTMLGLTLSTPPQRTTSTHSLVYVSDRADDGAMNGHVTKSGTAQNLCGNAVANLKQPDSDDDASDSGTEWDRHQYQPLGRTAKKSSKRASISAHVETSFARPIELLSAAISKMKYSPSTPTTLCETLSHRDAATDRDCLLDKRETPAKMRPKRKQTPKIVGKIDPNISGSYALLSSPPNNDDHKIVGSSASEQSGTEVDTSDEADSDEAPSPRYTVLQESSWSLNKSHPQLDSSDLNMNVWTS